MSPVVSFNADLVFSMVDELGSEQLTGSVSANGADLVITISDPAAAVRGHRIPLAIVRAVAARVAAAGATVQFDGPNGMLARIGAVRTSALTRLLTRSTFIELGDRRAYLPVLRAARSLANDPVLTVPPLTLFPLVPTFNRRIRQRITTTHYLPGSGRPRLIFVVGSENWNGQPARQFDLLPDVTTIGSEPGDDLQLAGLERLRAEIRHDSQDEYVLFVAGETSGRVLRTGARIELGPWRMAYFREEFADHGRPFGGRQGGELEHQKRQGRRPRN